MYPYFPWTFTGNKASGRLAIALMLRINNTIAVNNGRARHLGFMDLCPEVDGP